MVLSPRFEDVDIYPLANNRGNEAIMMKPTNLSPFEVRNHLRLRLIMLTSQKGNKGENDISEGAVDPPIKHGIKWSVFHGVVIRLGNFLEEIQEEGKKADTYFRDLKTSVPFQISLFLNKNIMNPIPNKFRLS